MCSRIIYKTGNNEFITGRGMDWNDPSAATSLWIFPRGVKRDGAIGDNPIEWTSQYGSVATSFYNAATADGMNEKGLVSNVHYLVEADYGDPSKSDKPTLSIGAWGQFILDNYASVEEVIDAMKNAPFIIDAPILPNGRPSNVHMAISDPTGDSAILEYLDGELIIHHGKQYNVMTNSPRFEEQIAINNYWETIGGNRMLPGTINAADRFVRLNYALKASPQYTDKEMATASVFSQMRAISVPLGMEDKDHPNISATLWRTIADNQTNRYYFDSALRASVFYVDLNKVDFSENAAIKTLNCDTGISYAGDTSEYFQVAEPFKFMTK